MQIIEDPTCRYCLDGSGHLLSPCKCKGTQGYIHLDCQTQAYNKTKSYSCPICLSQFTNVIINYYEYIEEDQWAESLCSTCIRYISPILHIILSTVVTSITSSYALYTIVWQTIISCSLLLTNCTYRVKNRKRYVYLLCTTLYNNYILLHACILLYLYITLQQTKSITYYVLLLTSTTLIHTYELQHIRILRQINSEIDYTSSILFISD